MKRFMLCLLLFPLAVMAQAPSYPVRLDLQSPSRTFALKWAAGSSPILSAYVSDGGRAYTNLSGWTGYVYVAVTPTAGVYVAASPVGSNRVNFSFTASQTATVGTFGVEVVLGNGTNTYRWGTGSLALSNSPALLGAGTVPLTGVFNWDLYTFTGTQPPLSASYTNALAGDVTGVPGATVIADGAVGTNNLDAEVRGMLETTGIDTNDSAWTGLVAQASAAASTGTAAYALAQAAAATGTAAYALAASANSTSANSVQQGGSITGTVGVGINGSSSDGLLMLFPDSPTGAKSRPIQGLFSKSASPFVYGTASFYANADSGGTGHWFYTVSDFYGTRTGRVYGTTDQLNAATLGGYLPTDFALLTTLSTGGYLRITSGAVTSNSMPGTRGEYRRTTTNAYFHDGSQWVTWVVSTNFSH